MQIQFTMDLWIFASGLVGLIVWFLRLEGRVKAAEKANDLTQKQVDALQLKHEALDSKVVNQLAEIREALARIEGRLGADLGR